MHEGRGAASPADGTRAAGGSAFALPPAPSRAAAAAAAVMSSEEILLAFDFGARRIGVAMGNGVTRQARPLAVIADAGDVRWRRIAELVAAWQPARLVVGVPRHLDGAPHELTARCERFARQLEGRFRLPVARIDERYSSVTVADGRDDEAAAVILQQWFDEERAATAGRASAAAPLRDAGDIHD